MNNAILIKQLTHKCLNLKLVTKTNSHNTLSLVNNFLWHYSQFRSNYWYTCMTLNMKFKLIIFPMNKSLKWLKLSCFKVHVGWLNNWVFFIFSSQEVDVSSAEWIPWSATWANHKQLVEWHTISKGDNAFWWKF